MEWDRARGQPDRAWEAGQRLLAEVDLAPVNEGVVRLAVIEMMLQRDDDITSAVSELEAMLDRRPHGYVRAHLWITLQRAGLASPDVALRIIHKGPAPLR